jgi:hypothetical protein
LLHLAIKKPKGKEPIIDYSQLHVMILDEYLEILNGKALGKKFTIEETKDTKHKDKA